MQRISWESNSCAAVRHSAVVWPLVVGDSAVINTRNYAKGMIELLSGLQRFFGAFTQGWTFPKAERATLG